jgi:hypothetical protein
VVFLYFGLLSAGGARLGCFTRISSKTCKKPEQQMFNTLPSNAFVITYFASASAPQEPQFIVFSIISLCRENETVPPAL